MVRGVNCQVKMYKRGCGQKPEPESGTRRRSAQTCILTRIG